ncbi:MULTISPECIES: glycosyltransferase [unclassified Sphingomonas]|uniref:glycosyltransferase n=1 Tax=unclassified Sphingomonas TaxID=196159 RepID=UPI002269B646
MSGSGRPIGRTRAPRIVLAPTGTLGDIYPFLDVAIQLRALGFDPLLATMEEYRGVAEAEGIAFHAVRPGRAELEADGHDHAMLARAVARDLRASFRFVAPHATEGFADLQAAMAGAALVVGGALSTIARVAAEAAGLPLVTLVLQPMGFLSVTDPPCLGARPWLRAVGRHGGAGSVRALYALASLRERSSLDMANRLRAGAGLPRMRDELREGPRRSERLIAMYPAAFAPLPADAPPQALSAGFSFYNGRTDRAVPAMAALSRFLDEGAPPIVFTLGSFVVHAPGEFFAHAATIARNLGRRAVLLVGDHAVERHAALGGPDVLVIGQAPHALLFPRAAAAVHHGGIGTTGQALRAALPQMVCAFFGDQFDNADHLRRLGVAEARPLRRFDAAAGTAMLGRLLSSPGIAARAATLATASGAADGPHIAADAIAAVALRHARLRLAA